MFLILMVVGYFMLLLLGPQPRVGRLDICQSFPATWCAPSAFKANLTFLGNFGLRFSLTRNGTAQQWQGQRPFRFFCLGRTSASRNFPLAGTQMRTVRASFILVCSSLSTWHPSHPYSDSCCDTGWQTLVSHHKYHRIMSWTKARKSDKEWTCYRKRLCPNNPSRTTHSSHRRQLSLSHQYGKATILIQQLVTKGATKPNTAWDQDGVWGHGLWAWRSLKGLSPKEEFQEWDLVTTGQSLGFKPTWERNAKRLASVCCYITLWRPWSSCPKVVSISLLSLCLTSFFFFFFLYCMVQDPFLMQHLYMHPNV